MKVTKFYYSYLDNINLVNNLVWTVSTLTGQQKGSHPTPPPPAPFPATYSDDFEGYAVGQEADYFADQTGVWEVSQESIIMLRDLMR